MATVKMKMARPTKRARIADESSGNSKRKGTKKVHKVNLKHLVDDDDDDDSPWVGGVAGALLGGVAGALLGVVLGIMA